MQYNHRKVAGLLFFAGGVICTLGIIVSEALYPGYSTSDNYISDLGVGPSAVIFNSSLILLGICVLCGCCLITKKLGFKIFTIVGTIAGIGAIGVGIFTEEAGIFHFFFSLVIFLFAGLSAIASSTLQRPPFSYFSIILGTMTLLDLFLFGSRIYLGLGKGGMERMIAYPALLWLIGFGAYLMASTDPTSS